MIHRKAAENAKHRMSMEDLRLCSVVIFAVALVVGCRSVRRGEPIVGPLNSPDPDVQKGRIVFQENCYKCHPGGEGGLGPVINDKSLPRFLMKTQVRAGLGVMPSFHKNDIPPEELDALVKYIVAQRKHIGTGGQH